MNSLSPFHLNYIHPYPPFLTPLQKYPIANGQVARFGLILADESGSCNITFWGPTASRSCSQLLVGQVILLQNLNIGISITSNENYYKEEDGGGVAGFANNVSVWASFSDDHSFNNNNKKMSSSSLHNLSTCRGILSTPSFMMESRLHSIHETRNLVCKCIVVGIRDVSSNGVIHARNSKRKKREDLRRCKLTTEYPFFISASLDDTCKRPIKLDPQGTRICEFCAEYINNGSMADETYTFHIIVEICDGVSGLSAAVSHQAAIVKRKGRD